MSNCTMCGMDIESLYPSVEIDVAVERCMDIICESAVIFHVVKTGEQRSLQKIVCNNEYLEQHDLSRYPTIKAAAKKNITER